MKHNYLLFTYHELVKKYRKYSSRLQRHLDKGTFGGLTASRKNFLVRKVEELRMRLQQLQPKLAGTAAAVALTTALGLSDAAAQPFVKNDLKNPFGAPSQIGIQNSHPYTVPAIGDLDHDGKLDLLVSSDRSFYYYKNTGTNSVPAYTEQSGTDNPMDSYSAEYSYPPLSLADIDGDGDLDLLAGGYLYNYGPVVFYENTGNISSPVFTERTGTDNIFPASGNYLTMASPSLVDIDGDGDKDLFVMDGLAGTVSFFENTGTATSPSFVENTSFTPFPSGDIKPSPTGKYALTTFADLDGDGDMDAFIGIYDNLIAYYKNTGTVSAASFLLVTGTDNPLNDFTKSHWQAPSFADVTGDGVLDLILGEKDKTVLYVNTGTTTAPVFNNADAMNFGQYARIRLADIDGDSDLDATFSGTDNPLHYVVNTGSASAPAFTEATGTNNPFNSIYSLISNAHVDLDGDHDLDLVIGYWDGSFAYYENIGTATAPQYNQVTGTDNPLDGLTNGASASSVVFVDLDNDGDMDLASGVNNGTMVYFENTGSATNAVFSAVTGTDNPFNTVSSSNYNYPVFVNFDGDGDMDLVIGTGYGGIYYYLNTGSASSPMFVEQSGTDNPFEVVGNDLGTSNQYFATAFMDVDADGDLDLLVSQEQGNVYLYENKTTSVVTDVNGGTSSPAFQNDILAFPNPTKDVLMFSLNDGVGNTMRAVVIDTKGQEMLSSEFNNNGSAVSLNVSSLTTGIYTLRVSTNDKVAVTKFIKQ